MAGVISEHGECGHDMGRDTGLKRANFSHSPKELFLYICFTFSSFCSFFIDIFTLHFYVSLYDFELKEIVSV